MGHASQAKHGSSPNKVSSSRKSSKPTPTKKSSPAAKAGGSAAKKGGTTSKTGPSSSKKLMTLGFWSHHKSLPATSLGMSGHSLTAISPFWYSLTASGTLKSQVDMPLLAEARKLHIAITPLVNDATGTQAFLTSTATQTRAVQSIDRMIATMHFQGVNIDFEPPHTHLKSALTAFMVKLRDQLPRSDSITIDVVPHSGGAYDFPKLAPEVNQFAIMTYDEHSDGTPAGPVAALNWVTSIASRMKSAVPSSKIDLGVALYGYYWAAGSTHAVTVPYASITPAMKAKATWNSRYQEMTAHIGSDVYWWENRKGIAQKIALAKKDHLAGIAMWQVGYANGAIYSELLKNIGKQP